MSSLYIQITNVCNMRCPHCCFACSGKGSFITPEHFTKALSMVGEDTPFNMMTIGGGEPTLHERCLDFAWQSVRQCLAESESMGMSVVGIVTNGSVEDKACELARMAKNGLLSARLSYDRFHDVSMVSDRVKRAFNVKDRNEPDKVIDYSQRHHDEHDLRAVNQWDYSITPHGRALKNGIYNHPFQKVGSCCCEGVFITPDGTAWQCGCRKHAIGHLNDTAALLDVVYKLQDNEDLEIPCSQKKQV